MLQTLRIWKWTAMVDNDYNNNLYKNLVDNWPWQKPKDILANWKWAYNRYGGKKLLNQILSRTWSELRWHLHTRHQRKVKIELRLLSLETSIYTLECLAEEAEERAKELENANLHK